MMTRSTSATTKMVAMLWLALTDSIMNDYPEANDNTENNDNNGR